MKKFLFLIFAVAFASQTMASGLDKMVSLSQSVIMYDFYDVDRMQNGDVVADMRVTFPPKYFQKAAIMELTPIMKYEGGEKAFESKIIQGESVRADNEVCSFANGGTFRLIFKIPFEDRLRCSEFVLRAKVSFGKKEKVCPDIKIDCHRGLVPYTTQCGNSLVIIDFDNSKAFSWLIVYDINGKKGNRFETKVYPDDPRKRQILENNNVKDVFLNGFKGNVFPADGSYTFDGKVALNIETEEIEEREGKRKYNKGPYSEVEIFKGENNYHVYISYLDNSKISRATLSFKNDEFSKIRCWSIDDYIRNANEVALNYSNGDRFKGSVTYANGNIKPNNGVYTYKNGDKFIGNVAGKTVGGAFVEGTTTFVGNPNSVSGNWLSKYQLSATQLLELEKKKYPTEKKKYIEGKRTEETFFSYVDNGNKAFDAKKYDDAEHWYTLALNSIPDDMPLQENFLKSRIERLQILKLEEEDKKLSETIRTESIKKGNDKYVVEYTRMGYRLVGYDDKGRKKFEYENNNKGTINLSTWNMKIPNRGKLVRYNYDSRGVLDSRKYYNESQSYYYKETQNDDGGFRCNGIYENSGEFIDDILIDASLDIDYDLFYNSIYYYIMYFNDPKTGMKSKITRVPEKKAREWLLDYLYKLD